MQSNADTVEEYLASLPEDASYRRSAQVRDAINEHLPDGYAEQMDWGMISWVVPLETKPDTYNGKPLCYAALASQKQHMAVYLMGLYTDGPELELVQESSTPTAGSSSTWASRACASSRSTTCRSTSSARRSA